MTRIAPAPAEPSVVRILRANFSDTVVSSLRTLGRFVELAGRAGGGAVADIVRMRLSWPEAVRQSWFFVTATAVPAVLMAIPFGVIVSVQVGNLIHQLGADSLLGATGGLGVIKQGAPTATGLLLGGAAASAIAADLGARTIRDEIDALRVMGVDPVHRLVIPRLVAMVLVAPLVNILIMFVGIFAGYLVAAQGVTSGSYWLTFGSFTVVADVVVSLGKSVLFGLIVVIVACQRGLEAKGGPRGVADGVNAAVVLSVLGIVVADVALTQLTAMFLPVRLA